MKAACVLLTKGHFPIAFLFIYLLAANFACAQLNSVLYHLSDEPSTSNIKGRALIVQVGDSSQPHFLPQFRLSAWGDECTMTLALASAENAQFGQPTAIMISGTEGISVRQDNSITHQMYLRPDGNFEWEIILDSLPDTTRKSWNVLLFHVESHNLAFLYQGELTSDENSLDAVRPDSVIGSYAVYHSSQINNRLIVNNLDTIQNNYRTGKAFHIYRPRAHDNRGWTVWCNLNLDTVFSIAIPEEFLKAAVYPVTIDPTFGKTDIGATDAAFATTACRGMVAPDARHTAGAGESIKSYTAYSYTGTDPSYVDFAVYTFDGTYPVNRLASPVTLTINNIGSGTARWNETAEVTQSMNEGSTYVVACGNVFPTSSGPRTKYDSEANSMSSHTASTTLPSTWTHAAYNSARYSIYTTYIIPATPNFSLRRRDLIISGDRTR